METGRTCHLEAVSSVLAFALELALGVLFSRAVIWEEMLTVWRTRSNRHPALPPLIQQHSGVPGG